MRRQITVVLASLGNSSSWDLVADLSDGFVYTLYRLVVHQEDLQQRKIVFLLLAACIDRSIDPDKVATGVGCVV
jgi:hypothetical protein